MPQMKNKNIRIEDSEIEAIENIAIDLSNHMQIHITFSDIIRMGVKKIINEYKEE